MAATLHTFKDIFGADFLVDGQPIQLNKIVIPIIQRDYAQGRVSYEIERVRNRFLDSLYQAVTDEPVTLDFVYGDIDKNGVMTPLDGQQRLTTLYLLHWYAAKKESIEDSESEFLRKFSYETRYSARDFCEYLIRFKPSFKGALSEEIIDQIWFPLDWKKDPTVSAMLVMLDAIDEKFRDVEDLWKLLAEDHTIAFYFLPIRDMGLTDELYIKMNSRGKPLTAIEHFKAELEHELRRMDEDIARRILWKIDLDWTDMLWRYRGDDNLIDDEFLRYYRFICDIICYKNGGSTQGKHFNEIDFLKVYFSADNKEAVNNILLLETYFDCWCTLEEGKTPAEFLNQYISSTHSPGKIRIDNKTDILEDCLRNYTDLYGNRSRSFPLNKVILLYAVITYLLHRDDITEKQFVRRLRVVNNLCRNSEDEISDSEQRAAGNRMPAILRQVDAIILDGAIDEKIENNFNAYQLEEESKKLRWTEKNPKDEEKLYALEDHELLYGQIGIVGLDHPENFQKFEQLFDCDWDAVDCALLSIGDYTQVDKNGWRYQIGSGRMPKAWSNLFHKSASEGYEDTKEVLRQLLTMTDVISDEVLYKMKEDYLCGCEEKSLYDWRYYYLKYGDAFRPGRYGKIYWWNEFAYDMLVMHTDTNLSENAYQPFLKLIDEENLSRGNFGQSIEMGDQELLCEHDAYVIRDVETEKEIKRYAIRQNEQGIDTENRVKKMRRIYAGIKKRKSM